MKTAITAILLILSFSRLYAQEADYKAYFSDGLKLYQDSKYKESIGKFQQSFKLQKKAKTAYYIASCYYGMGSCDSSASYFKFVLDHRKELESDYISDCTKLLSACGYQVSYIPVRGGTDTRVSFTLSTPHKTDVNSKAINSEAERQKQLLKGNKTKAEVKVSVVKRKADSIAW